METTPNERIVLNQVADMLLCYAGEIKPRHPVWSNSLHLYGLYERLEGKTLSGVCASLVKKGLLKTIGYGAESCLELTEEGYAVYNSLLTTNKP